MSGLVSSEQPCKLVEHDQAIRSLRRRTRSRRRRILRVLFNSGLGATRPTGDRPRMQQMLDQADLVVTARLDRPDRALIGVARCITDFSWCCYLSELAVSSSAQGLGVGKGLIDETRRLIGPRVSLVLASMPDW